MNECKIDAKIQISDSIIAKESIISKKEQLQKNQFLLGERTQIKI